MQHASPCGRGPSQHEWGATTTRLGNMRRILSGAEKLESRGRVVCFPSNSGPSQGTSVHQLRGVPKRLRPITDLVLGPQVSYQGRKATNALSAKDRRDRQAYSQTFDAIGDAYTTTVRAFNNNSDSVSCSREHY